MFRRFHKYILILIVMGSVIAGAQSSRSNEVKIKQKAKKALLNIFQDLKNGEVAGKPQDWQAIHQAFVKDISVEFKFDLVVSILNTDPTRKLKQQEYVIYQIPKDIEGDIKNFIRSYFLDNFMMREILVYLHKRVWHRNGDIEQSQALLNFLRYTMKNSTISKGYNFEESEFNKKDLELEHKLTKIQWIDPEERSENVEYIKEEIKLIHSLYRAKSNGNFIYIRPDLWTNIMGLSKNLTGNQVLEFTISILRGPVDDIPVEVLKLLLTKIVRESLTDYKNGDRFLRALVDRERRADSFSVSYSNILNAIEDKLIIDSKHVDRNEPSIFLSYLILLADQRGKRELLTDVYEIMRSKNLPPFKLARYLNIDVFIPEFFVINFVNSLKYFTQSAEMRETTEYQEVLRHIFYRWPLSDDLSEKVLYFLEGELKTLRVNNTPGSIQDILPKESNQRSRGIRNMVDNFFQESNPTHFKIQKVLSELILLDNSWLTSKNELFLEKVLGADMVKKILKESGFERVHNRCFRLF